jgi:uridine kinase
MSAPPPFTALLGSAEDAERLGAELDLLVVPRETVVVREGDGDRDMFLLVAGEASERRGEVELGRLRAGDVFGGSELVLGTPRPSTIVAESELVLRRLSHARFEHLAEREPALALGFVRRVLASHAGTEPASLPGHVDVTMAGEVRTVALGTELGRLLPTDVDGERVVAALVDRRAVSLVARLRAGGTLEPLTTAHWEGSRVYRRSVGLLLLEAADRVRPDLELQLEHSLGYAERVRVRGTVASWSALADELNAKMLELVDEDLPLREKWWTVDEARAWFQQEGWRAAAELLRTSREATGRVVTFGRVHALRTDPIVPRTGMLSGFCVLAASDGLVLVHGEVDDLTAAPRGGTVLTPGTARSQSAATIARRSETMMRDHAHWLETMGVTDVAELNHACIRGDVSHLIRVAEGYHEKRVSQIADAIAARRDRVKIVTIAGPSSSGKTTFIKRLRVQLLVDGIRPRDISLDDYYLERDAVPRDAQGEADLEAFEALKSDLLHSHLARLLAGETVATARFDFRTGKSEPEGGPRIALQADDMLILEGIHGLNPRLVGSIPETEVFRVFVCPLAQLPFDRLARVHASDLRLLRRIVRDRHGRNTDAAATIARWPSVRDGERRHIFAYQHHADEVFDSSLIYELSVLRVFAERYLLEVPQDHASYTTAFRLLRLLDHFVTIYPDHVPPTSMLREFIGGSGFEY